MSEETKMTPQTELVVSEEKVQPKKTSDSFPRIEILKDEPVAEESESFADILYDQIMAVKSSEIVRLLNSERVNLRFGCRRWNRAVLAACNPISISVDEQNQCFVLDHEIDCI